MGRSIEYETVESEDGSVETVAVFHFGYVVDADEAGQEFIEFARRLEDDLCSRRACAP